MSTQILFEFVAKDINLQKQLKEQKELVKQLTEEILKTEEGTEQYDKLVESLINAKSSVKDLEIGLKATKRAFELSQVPTDSLAGLRIQYAALIDEISRLSKAERESTEGLALVAKADSIKKDINSIQESYGNFTGSVGDYRNKIIEAAQATGFFDAQIREQVGSLGDLGAIFKKAAEPISDLSQLSREFGVSVKENASFIKNLILSKIGFSKASRDAAKEQVDLSRSLRQSGASSSVAAAGIRLIGAALKAAGIGIVLSLIGLLIDQLRKFDPVIKFVGRAFAAFGGAIQAVGDRVRQVIDIFSKFSFSNIAGSIKQLSTSFSGLSAEIKSAAISAFELKKRLDNLEDAQQIFNVLASEQAVEIEKLNAQLRDRTKSEKELLAIASRITMIEEEQFKQRRSFAKENIEIITEQIALGRRLEAQQIELLKTGSAAAFSLLKDLESEGRIVASDVEKFESALLELNRIESEAAARSEKIEVRTNQIRDRFSQQRERIREKELQSIEKQNERIIKLQEQLISATQTAPENKFAAQLLLAARERDKAIAELEKQATELDLQISKRGGKVTENDRKERKLIEENTKSILLSYQQRVDAIYKEEQRLFEEQRKRLDTEFEKIIANTKDYQKRLVDIEIEGVKDQARSRISEIENKFIAEKKLLEKSLLDREITQKKYNDRIKQIEDQRIKSLIDAENSNQEQINQLLKKQFELRIEAAESLYKSELAALNKAADEQRTQAIARARETGEDVAKELEIIDANLQIKIKDALTSRIEAERIAAKERVDIERQAAQAIQSIEDQSFEQRKRRREEEKQQIKDLFDVALQVAEKTSSQIAALDSQRLDRRVESELNSATLEADRRKAIAGGNAVEIEKIEADLQQKRKEIERNAARERQKIVIKEAIIQGALAVIKSLPNVALSVATGIATAFQIALIRGQKFEQGGLVKIDEKMYRVKGQTHAQGGVKGFIGGTQFEVEGDEVIAVVNKRNAYLINKLSEINAFRGNGIKFEYGGLIDPNNSVKRAVISGTFSTVSISQRDVEFLARALGESTRAGVEIGSRYGITEGARQQQLRQLSIDTSTF